ncbi:L,D-transpeptidase family protein [Solicola sp. PLA-1-18]|uniref:L,D-transpeptidase family protein n=1 Tax=Solicola sp. PLA-1-18 TaxID=3380532 RepID=UPI003B7E0B35
MRRLMLGGLATALLAATLMAVPASAATGGASAAAKASSGDTYLRKAFTRERTAPGDRDVSPTRIKHVRELQYRLRWAGVFKGGVTGTYGPATTKAVKKFQKRVGLRPSGVANHSTWRKLVKKTVRARSSIPKRCKSKGWNACYDRKRHRVTLFRNGTLHNEWLVRGGGTAYKTRIGDYKVFRRSKNHVSTIYETKMPYAQFFSGGQALHASYYMVDPFSGHSHGCVNMYIKDAKQLWNLTSRSTLKVHVYGAWS